jgi:prepilin-type N-terminal cleavage/methylation domain-containing protein
MKGFTMIEALIAVLVLGLVVTASLKLTALSASGLSQARETEALVKDAASIQIRAALDPLDIFGSSGDLRWRVTEKSSPLWPDGGIDIAAMSFSDSETLELEKFMQKDKRWREVEVARGGKSITIFLPQRKETISSDDKM